MFHPDLDNETHVVTLAVCYGDRGELHEVFRGSEAECRRLASRITCCSNDRLAVCHANVRWGLIVEWETHVGCMLRQGVMRGAGDERDGQD